MGLFVDAPVGVRMGDAVELAVDKDVGTPVGLLAGTLVGAPSGALEGAVVGLVVGELDGDVLGVEVGLSVNKEDGAAVSLTECHGRLGCRGLLRQCSGPCHCRVLGGKIASWK